MITCRLRNQDPGFKEGENFLRDHEIVPGVDSKANWTWEYLERDVAAFTHKIFRWRCRDTKNDIPFYYLELEKPVDENGAFKRVRYLSFRNNGERTMFLLTYFFR